MQDSNKCDLHKLIYKWQTSPSEYINLLMQEIYPTLKKLCKKEIKSYHINNRLVSTTATSIVNEIYISLSKGIKQDKVDSIRTFYTHLRDIVRGTLLDAHRQKTAEKRKLNSRNSSVQINENEVININNSACYPTKFDVIDFDYYLEELKHIDPNAAEAISFRYYASMSNNDLAIIMNKSIATVERYIKQGKKIISDLSNNKSAYA